MHGQLQRTVLCDTPASVLLGQPCHRRNGDIACFPALNPCIQIDRIARQLHLYIKSIQSKLYHIVAHQGDIAVFAIKMHLPIQTVTRFDRPVRPQLQRSMD